ncbi:probable inactive shikimate kinase like 1, chloroplastic isoform X3 [Morus notabilis]|uniref:probable inactive shikimate kinase like 1, chloroplastic isoform X3 n=1 Tax=Morus notabilis TaxID=981085 RepID=UPI000CED29DD|nr:probable inactive shikimate kinase like 1, chloroplastic isoform X3 [Morus notabilis]
MEITTTALHCTNHLHQIILTPLSRPTIASQFCFPMMRTRASLSRFPRPLFRTAFTITCFAADANASSKVGVLDRSFAVKKATDVSPALKGTSIFLVGMNSSIKTCLGKLLAETLRYYYFDSDSLVEDAAGGKSAFKSFKETDEQGFRESETEVLKQLSSMGRLVVCAGNGAVQSSTNLALLRHGISIWIDVPLDMVASGMMEEDQTEHAQQVVAQLGSSYEELRDGYATADATVSLQNVACQLGYDDLNAVTPEDMTLEVLKEIERLTRVKKMMEEAATPF